MGVSRGAFIREATAELFRHDVFEYFIDAALHGRERGHM
jgi:hypothetical protein